MLLVVNIIIKIFSLHNLVIDYRLFISVVFLIIYIYIFSIFSSCSEAEQPGSSALKDSPYISHVLTSMGPHYLKRMSMGAYGHWCIKPSQLFGSWLLVLEHTLLCVV